MCLRYDQINIFKYICNKRLSSLGIVYLFNIWLMLGFATAFVLVECKKAEFIAVNTKYMMMCWVIKRFKELLNLT